MVGWLHSFRKAGAVWPSTRTNDEINRPHGRPIRRAQGRSQKNRIDSKYATFYLHKWKWGPGFRFSNLERGSKAYIAFVVLQ